MGLQPANLSRLPLANVLLGFLGDLYLDQVTLRTTPVTMPITWALRE
jgi:hypothetical protein